MGAGDTDTVIETRYFLVTNKAGVIWQANIYHGSLVLSARNWKKFNCYS